MALCPCHHTNRPKVDSKQQQKEEEETDFYFICVININVSVWELNVKVKCKYIMQVIKFKKTYKGIILTNRFYSQWVIRIDLVWMFFFLNFSHCQSNVIVVCLFFFYFGWWHCPSVSHHISRAIAPIYRPKTNNTKKRRKHFVCIDVTFHMHYISLNQFIS